MAENDYRNHNGAGNLDSVMMDVIAIPSTGGCALVSTFKKNFNTESDLFIVKADSLGNTYTSYVRGQVFADLNNSCDLDDPASEYGFSNWIIQAQSPVDTFTTLTDADGNFLLRVETETMTLTAIPNNPYWLACPTKDTFSFTTVAYDTLDFEFPFSTVFDCPYLEVDIATPFLRRCFDNTYHVNYANQGSDTAFAAHIEVALDSFLLLDVGSISVPYNLIGDSLVNFELGDLPPAASGSFSFVVEVSCDAELGRTHCVAAHIFPDTICTTVDPAWDTSSIQVNGFCEGDSVLIEISNTGVGDMEAPRLGFIGQDDLIVYYFDFQLNAGEDTIIVVYPNGQTVHVEVEQSNGHPGHSMPSLSVEACGGGAVSLGFVNQFPADDADPFISIDCRQNIGAFDPNDKLPFPTGLGTQHIISKDTDLEYLLRFQNTGTETAFNIVVRDTLPPELDITTLKQGASSHDYFLDILPNNVLKFTFPDIMLPDSNVNEAASHGFVKFRINQVADNLPGTIIENSAGIYFDFNEPILTPTIFHTIEPPLLTIGEPDTVTVCAGEIYEGHTVFSDTTFFDTAFFTYNHYVDNQLVSPVISDTLDVDTMVYLGDSLLGQELVEPVILSDTLRDENGCDVLIVFYDVGLISGVGEEAKNSLWIYPNPTNNDLFIQLPARVKSDFYEIKILSLDGHLLFDKTIDLHQKGSLLKLPIRQLPAGMKVIQLRTERAVFNRRFLKN